MSDLERHAESVTDRASFVRLLSAMAAEVRADPRAWENHDLGSFLDAMGSWIEDMDGYCVNLRLEQPVDINWAFMRDAVMAARIYE